MTAALATPAIGAIPSRSATPAIQDDRLGFPGADPDARMSQIAALGARVVRVDLRWDLVAPTRPQNPADPNDPAYDWSWYDKVAAAAKARGILVLFTVWGTPDWAADPSVPADAKFGATSRQPANAADYGALGSALARHYAPLGVHMWEAWNEPNLPLFLRPQFVKVGKSWRNTSAKKYSDLATAFYTAVKAADPEATVAGLVTGPAGDNKPTSATSRTAPLTFVTEIAKRGLRPPMDAVSHHPYPLSLPRPGTPKVATFVDIYNLDFLRRRIDGTYLKGKPMWLTEVGFATEPVENYKKTIVSPAVQANLLSDAYARSRLDSRVHLTSWYFLQDARDWRSGLYDQRGVPKPASGAFKFPFAASTARVAPGRPTLLLGQVRLTRAATQVRVEQRVGSKYTLVKAVTTTPDGSFQLAVRPRRSTIYRARWTDGTGQTMTTGQVSVTVTRRK